MKKLPIKLRDILYYTLALICLSACENDQRKQQLDEREKSLMAKEMEFAAKEADYQSLIQMRDSVMSRKMDTTIITRWPADIPGIWTGKTVCNESDCSDYVVGDQRTDTWVFANDTTSIFTKIINKEKLIRVYTASVDSTQISLHYKSDSTATRKVDIRVLLNASGKNQMKGTQTILVNENCEAKFTVELERTAKL
ncbi:hypothetical protein ACXZ1K_12035 [Pedobacter sp. PWIIR3]